eukprot:scaffold1833_cov263-Chaetoceros_neogracile.AAC.22
MKPNVQRSEDDAAAWGQWPSSMHELGHHLGHSHSGKDVVTYADPTFIMGNRGSWASVSTHPRRGPTSGWDHNSATGQGIVIKIESSGETDL